MSIWPSKDPDAYVRGGAAHTGTVDGSEPPYWVWLPVSLAGASLIVLGAAVVGALRPTAWVWIVLGGIWVSKSQIWRWWHHTHATRVVSWRPAAAFAMGVLLVGLAATTLVDGRRDRSLVLFVALLIAWFGGDAFDWQLRRRRAVGDAELPR